MTINTLSLSSFAELGIDVIIIGSGPAGLAIALQFLQTDVKVAILESGGMHRDEQTDALNEIESIGQPRAPHDTVGCRGFGGTSFLWTGRCGSLDAVDYKQRPWLPGSGWPVDPEDLAPYYQRAGQFLGLAATRSAEHAQRELYNSSDTPPFNSALFKPVVWQFSRSDVLGDASVRDFTPEGKLPTELLQHTGAPAAVNVGQRYGEIIKSSQNIHMFTSSTVQEILVDPANGRASGVSVYDVNGERFLLKAPIVVVAAGGIQNPRLLLASKSTNPRGLGNDYGTVGRYLADHHFTEMAVFRGPKNKNLRRRLGSRWHASLARSRIHVLGIRLAEEVQRTNGLLNASLHMVEFGSRRNPFSSFVNGVRNLKKGQIGDAAGEIMGGLARPAGLVSGAFDGVVAKRPPLSSPDRSVVGCVLEQELQWESRVSLSDKTDRYGLPLAQVDWRISDREFQTARVVEQLFNDEARRLGFGHYERPAWRDGDIDQWKADLLDLAHPSCSTRMSADPEQGVVDENCQVHGVPGLYVAGSSVFATNSHMNPTQTLVALAIRLADHIKKQYTARIPAVATVEPQRRVRVGFIGGGHRVETIYAPVMKALSKEIEVCGTVTRSSEGADRIAQKTGWRSSTDLSSFLESERPDFLIVAVPPGAVDGAYPDLVNRGIPLLLETPACWNESIGRRIKATIDGRQLLVGVAEQFPFLPEVQLKNALISSGLIGQVNAVVNDFAIYDYHGMATLRFLMGNHRRPVSVQGKSMSLGAQETWLSGTVSFDDGSFVEHRFSPDYETVTHRPLGSLKVYGSLGTLLPGEARFDLGDSKDFVAPVVRKEVQGGLKSLSVDTPDGIVKWENPIPGYGLSDEQIAVACLVRSMANAVQFAGYPSYPYWSALEDVELVNSIGYSASRQGRKISLPTSRTKQKIMIKLGNLVRKV